MAEMWYDIENAKALVAHALAGRKGLAFADAMQRVSYGAELNLATSTGDTFLHLGAQYELPWFVEMLCLLGAGRYQEGGAKADMVYVGAAPQALADTPQAKAEAAAMGMRLTEGHHNPLNVNAENDKGLTALHIAARSIDVRSVLALLSCGASCDQRASGDYLIGATPLFIAAISRPRTIPDSFVGMQPGARKMIQALVDKGANIHVALEGGCSLLATMAMASEISEDDMKFVTGVGGSVYMAELELARFLSEPTRRFVVVRGPLSDAQKRVEFEKGMERLANLAVDVTSETHRTNIKTTCGGCCLAFDAKVLKLQSCLCKKAFYCSKKCQKVHWNRAVGGHTAVCPFAKW